MPPSGHLNAQHFLDVANCILVERIGDDHAFMNVIFSTPYTPATSDPAISDPAISTTCNSTVSDLHSEFEAEMTGLYRKETSGIPLLGVFVVKLAVELGKNIPDLKFVSEMEFAVVYGSQRGVKPACDAAVAVVEATSRKPVILYEYKPVVDTRWNHVKQNDLMELLIQGYYCLHYHQVSTVIHCLTDLSQ